MASPTVVYQGFAPPYYSTNTTHVAWISLPHRAVNRYVVMSNVSGVVSIDQNSSSYTNGSAQQTTSVWFLSRPYRIPANVTALHVDAYGTSSGFARERETCGQAGFSSTSFNYTLTVGLWDRNASSWVASRTLVLQSAGFWSNCFYSGGGRLARNLTFSWGLGVRPSAAAINSTHWFQISVEIAVETYIGSWYGGSAFTGVKVTDSVQRMQGSYS